MSSLTCSHLFGDWDLIIDTMSRQHGGGATESQDLLITWYASGPLLLLQVHMFMPVPVTLVCFQGHRCGDEKIQGCILL